MTLALLSSKPFAPLSSAEYQTILNAFMKRFPWNSELANKKIGVAISGGPDSMALLFMLKSVFGANKIKAYMVDHGLKDVIKCTEDTASVQQVCDENSVEMQVLKLKWQEGDHSKAGKLMLKARDLRYKVILEAAAKDEIPLVLTGHNLDDDIITAVYRMARMSGVDGIAGMREFSFFPVLSPNAPKVLLGRPLLSIPKSRLLDTCQEMNVKWFMDESNKDLSFVRNLVRDSLIELQKQDSSLSVEALGNLMNSVKGHSKELQNQLSEVFTKSVVLDELNGSAVVFPQLQWMEKEYLASRVFTTLIQYGSVSFHPPKLTSILSYISSLKESCAEKSAKKKATEKRLINAGKGRFIQVPLPTENLRRLETPQATMGGAVCYPLSSRDSAFRTKTAMFNEGILPGRRLDYSAGILIQRECIKLALIEKETPIKVIPGKPFLWDDRFFITVRWADGRDSKEPINFIIKHLQPEDVALYRSIHSRLPKALYNFLAGTPGRHLYVIPIMKEYLADNSIKSIILPSLNITSNSEYSRVLIA